MLSVVLTKYVLCVATSSVTLAVFSGRTRDGLISACSSCKFDNIKQIEQIEIRAQKYIVVHVAYLAVIFQQGIPLQSCPSVGKGHRSIKIR